MGVARARSRGDLGAAELFAGLTRVQERRADGGALDAPRQVDEGKCGRHRGLKRNRETEQSY